MDNIQVILFDDSAIIREALTESINEMQGFHLVAAFEDCSTMYLDIESTNPDLVLMDIQMPFMNGVEAVTLIRQKYLNVPILMLTVVEDDETIFNSIAAGANGYILKDAESEKLAEYMKEALEGGAPLSPMVARKVIQHLHVTKPIQPTYDLSERELEVLDLIVKGLPYKLIASELHIAYDTVRFHVKKIYEKLHVGSLTEVVAKAIQENITK
jgi:DNA-binding NarL/FixJ family response regulator